MATMAYVGSKYGDATDTDNTAGSAVNQSISVPTTSGVYLGVVNYKNVACPASITRMVNGTDGTIIAAGNYTYTAATCKITNATSFTGQGFSVPKVDYTYTYSASTVASNTTDSLQTEINNNTSIAGIVLTISLVGIVLAILIGIFMAARRNGM
jgi:hypothetical protein